MSDQHSISRHDAALASLAGSEIFQRFDLSACLRQIVETGAEGLETARCSVWLRRSEPLSLICASLYDETSGGHSSGPSLIEAEHPDYFHLLDNPHPLTFLLADPDLPDSLRDFMAERHFSALMHLPVVVQGELAAILAFADRQPGRQWSETDQSFGAVLAGLTALAFRGDALRREVESLRPADKEPVLRVVPPPTTAPCQPHRQGSTVLLVDGDTVLHDLLGEALSHGSYRLIHAFDAEQGFDLATELLPEVIVLNVLSSGLDGWGLLAKLKSDDRVRHVPVVAMTMTDEDDAGYLLRASDFLTKPFRFELLLEIINRHRPDDGVPRALVIEDEDVTRSILARLLERDGWQVDLAANGFEGLRQLDRGRPAVVLLDLMMPGMDGFEFIKMLRMTEPAGSRLPVVVITAKDLSDDERTWLTGTTRTIAAKDSVGRLELVEGIRDWVTHATTRGTMVV